METLYEIETFKIKLAVAEPTLTPARCSLDAAAILRPIYADLDADQEHFSILLLNNKNRVRAHKLVSSGSLTASLVHPREVFKSVILYGAAAVILCHNHPSGDPEPSPEDVEITHRLVQCGEIFGIRMLDHVILGRDSIFSFSDSGMMHAPHVPIEPSRPGTNGRAAEH
jgi:DNA repair protein RadC